VARKGKTRAVQPLGNVARRIQPQEEEGHLFLARLVQRGKRCAVCSKLVPNRRAIASMS
jgi:hypothetical protein